MHYCALGRRISIGLSQQPAGMLCILMESLVCRGALSFTGGGGAVHSRFFVVGCFTRWCRLRLLSHEKFIVFPVASLSSSLCGLVLVWPYVRGV